jgi:uncharacterized protein
MFSEIEGRVLGCLIEKERTTPDQYPLSLNALCLACNQTTAREPVFQLEQDQVQSATTSLKLAGMLRVVHPSHGRSVTRFRQVADEHFSWSTAQSAVVSTLLLRGPQTIGELRSRSERLHNFSSLDEVEATLLGLGQGEQPVVELAPRSTGQKEARWQQLLAECSVVTSDRPVRTVPNDRYDELEARVARLEAALADLLG